MVDLHNQRALPEFTVFDRMRGVEYEYPIFVRISTGVPQGQDLLHGETDALEERLYQAVGVAKENKRLHREGGKYHTGPVRRLGDVCRQECGGTKATGSD